MQCNGRREANDRSRGVNGVRGLRCRIANRLWYLSCLREARAFHLGLDAVAATQERLLLEMLRANRFTTFGQEHGFARIGSVREYQQALPLRDYQEIAPLIENICAFKASSKVPMNSRGLS